MRHTHTHTHRNQQIGCMYRHICYHTPARAHTHTHTHTHAHTHTHTHTHFDIGIGTMWLPSLQAVVVGGLFFFRTFVTGVRELEN